VTNVNEETGVPNIRVEAAAEAFFASPNSGHSRASPTRSSTFLILANISEYINLYFMILTTYRTVTTH
jgi:hypothetical protein